MDETPQGEREAGVAVDDESELRSEWPPPLRRPLRRRGHGKWVAGVAGGLADHWGVPALAVRIPLAIGAFVAAGVSWQIYTSGESIDAPDGIFVPIVAASFVATIAYFVLWATVPHEDAPRSAARRVGARFSPHRLTERYPNIRAIPAFLALGIGGAILANRLGIWEPDLALAAGLIALGVWLYRRDREVRSGVRVVDADAGEISAGGGTISGPERLTYEPVVHAARERSPLGWITFGIALLVICVAAIWTRADGLARIGVVPALGLLVLAAGLLVGSVFGRSRWLILPALALVPAVLLTSVVRLPFEGPIGDTFLRVGPPSDDANTEVVARTRAFGSIHVDLNRLRGSDVTRELELSTVAGAVTVVVPFDAHVEVHAFTGLGTIGLERRSEYGVELTESASLDPRHGDGATVIVDAEVGLGNVHVLRYAPTKRQLRTVERDDRRTERRGDDGGGS